MRDFKSDLLFHSDARSKMIEGASILSEAVSVTLGPKGKNVAIAYPGERPHLTKDGVTVANAINLKDPYQNLGCQIVKEAAQRSAEVAGDGTTTSTVLASALLSDGHRLLETGHDSKDVIRGMESACNQVISSLEDTKTKLEEDHQLRSVATISANGEEEIGEIIASAIEAVGADGPISVEDARGFKTSLEVVEGTVIDRGYLSPYFVTDQTRALCELDNPLIFIYNQSINTAKTILPVLEKSASQNRPLLIISNDVTSEALKTLVLNKMKGAISVCAIKAPEFGAARTQALQDLATVCGASVVAVDLSEDDGSLDEVLGTTEKVVVSKNGSMFIGTSGDKEKIRERVEQCKSRLVDEVLTESDVALIKRRMRRMSDGVAIIRAGGSTEVEMNERKDRIDDALCASRAAKKSGVQPGGGIALIHAAKRATKNKPKNCTDSFASGYDAFIKACQSPLRQIVKNAGEVPEIVMRKVQKGNTKTTGYDASNGEFGEMFDMNIIDPHDVVVSALSHATSVACNILSIGCAVSLELQMEEKLGLIEDL
jgi:chaperonin GroEL